MISQERIRVLVERLAEQQAMPDDWWKSELESILAASAPANCCLGCTDECKVYGSQHPIAASAPALSTLTVTDAMVDAYLEANNAYWHFSDQLPSKPGVWRNGTPREATKVSLEAALAASAPALQAGQGEPDYQRGYQDGYNQRDAEVRGALA